MKNPIRNWFHGSDKAREVTLEDVTPLHPDEYPGQHLKELLHARREEMENRPHPTGMLDGPGPLT